MKLKLGLDKRLFLFVVPLVTGSIFATSTSQGATLARSDAFVTISNFSQSPESTSTSSDTSLIGGHSVISQANADAIFLTEPAFAFTDSSIEAFGSDQEHFSEIQSNLTVLGNFFIDATKCSPQSFSFDFNTSLKLATSIDSSSREFASVATDIHLFLVDRTDSENHKILDSFTISSKLTTTGEDKSLSYQKSNNFTLKHFFSFVGIGSDIQQEHADVQALGSYSRDFNTRTRLSVIGVQNTEVAVEAQVEAEVPEPSSILAVFLFSSFIGTRLLRKH